MLLTIEKIKRIIIILVFITMINPAIHIGKAWQSTFQLGPMVDVQQIDGQVVRGQISYALNGKVAVIDENGRQHLLGEHFIISSTMSAPNMDKDQFQHLANSWRELAPLGLITLLLLLCLLNSSLPKFGPRRNIEWLLIERNPNELDKKHTL